MTFYKLTLFVLILLTSAFAASQEKKYAVHTVAFYNFENLFDTIDGTNNDEEWLPKGMQNWTGRKYKKNSPICHVCYLLLEQMSNIKQCQCLLEAAKLKTEMFLKIWSNILL